MTVSLGLKCLAPNCDANAVRAGLCWRDYRIQLKAHGRVSSRDMTALHTVLRGIERRINKSLKTVKGGSTAEARLLTLLQKNAVDAAKLFGMGEAGAGVWEMECGCGEKREIPLSPCRHAPTLFEVLRQLRAAPPEGRAMESGIDVPERRRLDGNNTSAS